MGRLLWEEDSRLVLKLHRIAVESIRDNDGGEVQWMSRSAMDRLYSAAHKALEAAENAKSTGFSEMLVGY